MKNLLLALLAYTITFASCSQFYCLTKESYLSSYKDFVKMIEEDSYNFSTNDWKRHDATFEQYAKECYEQYKDDLTASQKEQYWEATITYYSLKYKGDFLSIIRDGSDDLSKFIDHELESSLSVVEQELKKVSEKLKSEEFKNIFKGLKDDFEDFAKDLKEIIEENEK